MRETRVIKNLADEANEMRALRITTLPVVPVIRRRRPCIIFFSKLQSFRSQETESELNEVSE